MIMMFVFRIINANNSKPNKRNTHESKERNEVINFLSISGFKPKAVRLLRLKYAFNRSKAIRIITDSTRRNIISNKIPRFRVRRRLRDNDSRR